MVDVDDTMNNVREWVDDNFIVSIIIGAAAICLCISLCIGCCCCCRFWRNNKKRKIQQDKIFGSEIPMTPAEDDIESPNSGYHTKPLPAPPKTKSLAPPNGSAMTLKPGSNRSIVDNTMDWANPDNYGKWTGSQMSIISADDDHGNEHEMKNELVPKDQQIPSLKTIFGKNKGNQNNNNPQDNIQRHEDSDSDSLMRKQNKYGNNANMNY